MNSLLLKALVNIPDINPGTDIADLIFNNIHLKVVPSLRIELKIYPYHGHVIPFNYKGSCLI